MATNRETYELTTLPTFQCFLSIRVESPTLCRYQASDFGSKGRDVVVTEFASLQHILAFQTELVFLVEVASTCMSNFIHDVQ